MKLFRDGYGLGCIYYYVVLIMFWFWVFFVSYLNYMNKLNFFLILLLYKCIVSEERFFEGRLLYYF